MSFNFNQTPGFNFGSATPTTSTPSLFGSQTSTFGQASTPSFGATPFGGQTAQQPLFGAQPQNTFGSTAFGSTPGFGSTAPAFGTPTPQPNAPQVFGGFGTPTQQQTVPSFNTGFGGQSTPSTSAPTTGLFSFPTSQQSTPLFGAQTPASTAGVFGSPFATPSTQTQSTQPSLFATPQQTQQPTSPPTLSFGSTPGFGSTFGQTSSVPAFGASITPSAPTPTATPLFGATNLQTSSAPTSAAPAFSGFGAATGFGAPTPTSAAPSFNFGSAMPTGTTITPSVSFSMTAATPSTISTSAPGQTSFGSAGLGLSSTTMGTTTSTPGFGLGAPVATTSLPVSTGLSSFSFPSTTTIASVHPLTTNTAQPVVTPIATITTSATTASGFNFGAATSAPAFTLSTSSTTPSTTNASVAPFGLNLSTSTTAAASVTPTFTLSTTTAPKTSSFALQPTTSTSTTTAQPITSSTPTRMTFRQLEEQINLWLNELNQLEAEFHTQAQTINSWDSLLINNGLKITKINESLEKLRTDHTRIDHQLDFIIAQQNELEQLLVPIENQTQKNESTSNDTVSAEREFTYSMVETVHNDLNGIGTDLKNFIKKLNEMRSNQDSTDPLAQISKILNSHMDALQWIENQIKSIKITAN